MRFAVINQGVVENIVVAQAALSEVMVALDGLEVQPDRGWSWDGETFAPPPAPPAPDYGTRITPLAYLSRVGLEAEVAIEVAAESDPVVRVLLRRVTTARYIDLTHPDTLQGMAVLVGKGLLTQPQASAILSAPVQAYEVA